jgi:heme-degrading monooxygenase HmoA
VYARLVRFPAKPGKRVVVETLADEVFEMSKTLPGFISANYMFSDEDNLYCSLTLWTGMEEAQNGTKVLGREFGMQLADLATGAVEMTIMEVYEPKEPKGKK